MYTSNPDPSLSHLSKEKLWLAAIKPPMYSVAVVPIWVGSAIAFHESNQFNQPIFLLFLMSAILVVAWLNTSNDAFDAQTGIDIHKYHSLVHLTGNRALVFWLANGFLLLGILGLIAIAFLQKDITVLVLVGLSCFLGYTYQGPPFRLGYLGLGEPICLICFGPLAVLAAYYSQAQGFSMVAFLASIAIGMTTTAILFCSHFHQVEDDLKAGKRSPVARLGTARAARWLVWGCWGTLMWWVGWTLAGSFPLWSLIALATAPIAIHLCRRVARYHDVPEQVSNSKFIAVAWHFWSGLLLGLGFILGDLLTLSV